MDDLSHEDASSPTPSHEGEGGGPAASGSPEGVSPYRESPMFVDQDEEISAEPEQQGEHGDSESPMFVDQNEEMSVEPEQPGEHDHTQSPELAIPNEGEPSRPEQDAQDDNEASQPEEDSHDSGDRDEEALQESEDVGENEIPSTCTRACRQQAKDAAKKLEVANKTIKKQSNKIRILQAKLSEAKAEIRQLKRDLDIAQGEPAAPSPPKGAWRDTLRKFLAGEGGVNYPEVWKSSYRALNMSIDLEKVHPQVRFIPKEEDSVREESPHNETFFARPDEEVRSRIPPLPDNVLYKILKELLTKDGLVHCFSRLDPFCPPVDFPSEDDLGTKSTGLRGRFYVSKEQRALVSLTHDTEDPQTVLAAVSVCRKWAFYSLHIFYGVNTFSFSSLQELDRWCNGIGPARVARSQHWEITWTGGKSVSFDLGKSKKGIDLKSLPLSWLSECVSLKTLCIHISETGKTHIRRRREPASIKEYMAGKTSGQPNVRMTRALRNCRGMDYIYQLRGMHFVRWYDLNKESASGDRSLASIRDQSFVIDVERVVTQEKVPERLENSRLENLDVLFRNRASWKPSRQDFEMVRHIYEEANGYDTRLNDLDKDANSSQGTISSGSGASSSDSDSDSDSDDEDDDDDSGPALQTPPGSSRRRRPFTPAPSFGDHGREDSSESERDDLPHEGESHHSSSDGDESQDSGSDNDNAGSVTTEIFKRRRLSQYLRDNSQMAIVIDDDDDDIQEIPAPNSRLLSLFVTPGLEETSGTPETRAASGLLGRRTPSAAVVDLTGGNGGEDDGDGGNLGGGLGRPKEESASDVDEAGDVNGPTELNPGVKRARLTSTTSEGGGKRRRSSEYRLGSIPMQSQWAFPDEA
ncbi:hypothetical protein Daus18300_006422 [Diaporthe australafricana]|uniref:Uncharacterized protein n=1 Tax=Diaporthe australafricana TaxID=127596 RepID=A0ABR3WUE3_9PEZI